MSFKMEELLKNLTEGYKIFNFCTNYRMNDVIKESTFNKKYSHPEFIHVFYDGKEGNDFTERFFDAIDYRIRDNNNYVIVIYGEPNLGKSEGGQAIAKYTLERFQEIKRKKNKIRLGFSTMEFDKIIRIMKEGDIAIRDESPKGSGTGSRNIEQNLNNITQIVRAHQNFFIFICPKRIESDVVTYFLEAGGKNIEERKLRFILYDPTYKNGKIPIGRIFLELHDDEDFRKQYQEKKDANITLIKQKGGGVYHEIDSDQLSRDFLKLYNYCKKKNSTTKTNIKTQLSNHNIECTLNNSPEKSITGDIDYQQKLIQNVYNAFKKPNSLPKYLKKLIEKDLKEPDIEIPEIIYSNDSEFVNFIRRYYEKNLPESMEIGNKMINQKDIIGILISWISGVGIRDIAHSNQNLHQVIVNDIIKLFKDGKRHSTTIKDEWRVYKAFEYWCAKKYDLELISGHNQPDFFLKINDDKKIAGECKLWDDIQKNISLDKRKKFHAFKNFNNSQESFPVIIRNVKWGDHDYFFNVSMNGSNIFNFEKKEKHVLEDKEQLHSFYKKKIKR